MLEPDYYASQTKSGGPIKVVGWIVAFIMAVGSCFAAANTMYAAVAYRGREIATLRVIGFSRPSILTSFMLESLLLSLLGATLGIILMLPFNGMTTGTQNQVTFSEVVFSLQMTPAVVMAAVIFALIMGVVGGFAPAWHASRRDILSAPCETRNAFGRIGGRDARHYIKKMPIDAKHEDLQSLRIDRNARTGGEGEPPVWARRYILIGIGLLVLLGIVTISYRLFSHDAPEVEVVRASAQSSEVGGVVLSASGYIVAHHKINLNSKVTGRVKWIGVEKGDKVKEGQVLVRLEDDEFRAQYEQAQGAANNARAYLQELQNGSRPEEIQQAQHNLDEARATLVNDKITLDRTRGLVTEGVLSKQALDDATAKFESDQQRVNSLDKGFQLAKIGPRQEEIARARGALEQAQGQADYAKSLLDATVIRAPVTGTILERAAEKGELVTSGFASTAEGGPQGLVVSLADLNDLQVELDIAQDDFSRLGPKQKGVVTTDAYPDRKYDGVIAEISPQANRAKATVQVKVQILTPDAYLRPDMNATVKFLADENQHASSSQPQGVFVPTPAIHDRDGKKFLFLAFEGKAVAREVKIVSQRSGGVLVQGLNGGEDVITAAPQDLKDGEKIKIKGQS